MKIIMPQNHHELNKLFGNIDIYLLDQILKGVFPAGYKILDAGCDDGRNLLYFLRLGYEVYGIDREEEAIQMLRIMARSIDRSYPATERFSVGDVAAMPYDDAQFDAVISSAVLHFAVDEAHFLQMVGEHTRVLRRGGIFFGRMTTDIGIADNIKPLGGGRYVIPDGSERFLLTRHLLEEVVNRFGYQFLEPFRTVLVDDLRSMSTFVLKKT